MLTRSPGWNGPRFKRHGDTTFFYRRVDLFDADPMGAVQTAFLTHRLAKRAEDLTVGR